MSEKVTSKTVTTAALAYLGDCVIEMCVRSFLVSEGLSSSRHLNAEALHFVRASAQAEAAHKLLDILSQDEAAAYRRGRNIGHTNIPKSSSVSEYRQATGLEALFGYLSLEGKKERIDELFSIGYADKIENLRTKMQTQNK